MMASDNPVGTHVLVNVYDVPHAELLTHLDSGISTLDSIVRELQFHVVAQAGHQFSPMGYSYAYVLSESHFTIHTYPEYKSCYIDMFCCNPAFDPVHAVQVIQHKFHTQNVRYQVTRR
jgi:S-adenosylmethionine decarboxylase proenzyme